MDKFCNGICITGWELGVPHSGIAYAHPECELHGYQDEDCYHGYPGYGSGCPTCEFEESGQ